MNRRGLPCSQRIQPEFQPCTEPSSRQTAPVVNVWKHSPIVLAGLVALTFLAGCRHPQESPKGNPSAHENQTLLDEINAAQAWFHARKTRAIWARRLDQDHVIDTLEGQVPARAGDYLCRGAAGELWPQKAKSLEERYVSTDVRDAQGWRQYQPRPDAEGVLAAQVKHAFTVVATFGRLSGKAGDYVVKKFSDRHVAYPEDVWIVDQSLFNATYEAVKP